MATTFRKTGKGQAEIETRAHKLPPRLRSALIMVDGKRDDVELRKLILAEPEATLQALVEQGFIEPVGVTGEASPTARPPAPAASAAPAAAPAATPGLSRPAFEQLKREAVRALTDAAGPMGEALSLKIEKASTPAELRPLVELARQTIHNTRGGAAARAFAERFVAPLG